MTTLAGIAVVLSRFGSVGTWRIRDERHSNRNRKRHYEPTGANAMSEPVYSIGTYDWELGAYTPQEGLTVPSINIDLPTLRQAMRELRREHGYDAHRVRFADGSHDSDPNVLIERTDGFTEQQILESWKR